MPDTHKLYLSTGAFYFGHQRLPSDVALETTGIGSLEDPFVVVQGGGGGITDAVRTITTDSSVLITDRTILVDTTGGDVVLDYDPATITQIVVVKKISSDGNIVTIDPTGAATIDGDASRDLVEQFEGMTIHSDLTNLFII